MANELSMIKLLVDRVEAQGDSGRKQILGHFGQINDLCLAVLGRLHAGDPDAVTEIAEIHLLNDSLQAKGEKSEPARKLAQGFQDGIMTLLGMNTDMHRDQIDAAITKIELRQAVETK